VLKLRKRRISKCGSNFRQDVSGTVLHSGYPALAPDVTTVSPRLAKALPDVWTSRGYARVSRTHRVSDVTYGIGAQTEGKDK